MLIDMCAVPSRLLLILKTSFIPYRKLIPHVVDKEESSAAGLPFLPLQEWRILKDAKAYVLLQECLLHLLHLADRNARFAALVATPANTGMASLQTGTVEWVIVLPLLRALLPMLRLIQKRTSATVAGFTKADVDTPPDTTATSGSFLSAMTAGTPGWASQKKTSEVEPTPSSKGVAVTVDPVELIAQLLLAPKLQALREALSPALCTLASAMHPSESATVLQPTTAEPTAKMNHCTLLLLTAVASGGFLEGWEDRVLSRLGSVLDLMSALMPYFNVTFVLANTTADHDKLAGNLYFQLGAGRARGAAVLLRLFLCGRLTSAHVSKRLSHLVWLCRVLAPALLRATQGDECLSSESALALEYMLCAVNTADEKVLQLLEQRLSEGRVSARATLRLLAPLLPALHPTSYHNCIDNGVGSSQNLDDSDTSAPTAKPATSGSTLTRHRQPALYLSGIIGSMTLCNRWVANVMQQHDNRPAAMSAISNAEEIPVLQDRALLRVSARAECAAEAKELCELAEVLAEASEQTDDDSHHTLGTGETQDALAVHALLQAATCYTTKIHALHRSDVLAGALPRGGDAKQQEQRCVAELEDWRDVKALQMVVRAAQMEARLKQAQLANNFDSMSKEGEPQKPVSVLKRADVPSTDEETATNTAEAAPPSSLPPKASSLLELQVDMDGMQQHDAITIVRTHAHVLGPFLWHRLAAGAAPLSVLVLQVLLVYCRCTSGCPPSQQRNSLKANQCALAVVTAAAKLQALVSVGGEADSVQLDAATTMQIQKIWELLHLIVHEVAPASDAAFLPTGHSASPNNTLPNERVGLRRLWAASLSEQALAWRNVMLQLHKLSSSFAGDPSRDPYLVPRYFAWLALSRLSGAVLGRGPESADTVNASTDNADDLDNSMSTWTLCLQVFYDNINLIPNTKPLGVSSGEEAGLTQTDSTAMPAWMPSNVLSGFRSRFAAVRTRMVHGLHGAISRRDADCVATLTWLVEACSATSNPWVSSVGGSVPSAIAAGTLTESVLGLVRNLLQTHRQVLRFEGGRLALMVVALTENPHCPLPLLNKILALVSEALAQTDEGEGKAEDQYGFEEACIQEGLRRVRSKPKEKQPIDLGILDPQHTPSMHSSPTRVSPMLVHLAAMVVRRTSAATRKTLVPQLLPAIVNSLERKSGSDSSSEHNLIHSDDAMLTALRAFILSLGHIPSHTAETPKPAETAFNIPGDLLERLLVALEAHAETHASACSRVVDALTSWAIHTSIAGDGEGTKALLNLVLAAVNMQKRFKWNVSGALLESITAHLRELLAPGIVTANDTLDSDRNNTAEGIADKVATAQKDSTDDAAPAPLSASTVVRTKLSADLQIVLVGMSDARALQAPRLRWRRQALAAARNWLLIPVDSKMQLPAEKAETSCVVHLLTRWAVGHPELEMRVGALDALAAAAEASAQDRVKSGQGVMCVTRDLIFHSVCVILDFVASSGSVAPMGGSHQAALARVHTIDTARRLIRANTIGVTTESTASAKDEAQALVLRLREVLKAIWDRDQCADRRVFSLEECRSTLLSLATVLLSDAVVTANSWTELTPLLHNFLTLAVPPGTGSGKTLDVQSPGSVVASLCRALLDRVSVVEEAKEGEDLATAPPANVPALQQHVNTAPALNLQELLSHTKLESLQQILSRVEAEHARHEQHACATSDVTAATTMTEPKSTIVEPTVTNKEPVADQQLQKQLLLEHTLAQERADAALEQHRKQHELLLQLQELKATHALRRCVGVCCRNVCDNVFRLRICGWVCTLCICHKILAVVLTGTLLLSRSHFVLICCLCDICSTQRALELEKEKEALSEMKHQAELQRVRRLKVNANSTAATTTTSTQPRSVQPRSTQPRRIHTNSRNTNSRGATTRVRR